MHTHWMRLLSSHYVNIREQYPADKLLILFDIDGTILDMRHVIHHVLQNIDRKHGARHFAHLHISDVTIHEEQIEKFLDRFTIDPYEKRKILRSYRDDFWSSAMASQAQKAFNGVLEIIHLFQAQPNTFVGLNTGRPEALRFNTLASLNRLGKACKIHFRDDMLYMKPDHGEADITSAKILGAEYFQSRGYRIFAMVDNEPENLEAFARYFTGDDLLLLHADTISRSKPTLEHRQIVRGASYDLDEFIDGFSLRRSA